jgi:hypothetical protein
MELLSVISARSIWLGNLLDLNPRGKSLFSVLPMLHESYKFRKLPSVEEMIDSLKGVKFIDGDFQTKNGELIEVSLTVYNDGLMAETRSSTRDTDDFLDELLKNICGIFNLPDHNQAIKERLYLSQLFVTTNKSLELINPKLKNISKHLSDVYSYPYELGGISFWSDQTSKKPNPQFTFERAVNVPFSQKRYFTSAGLHTDEHLDLLDKLEKALSSR